MTSGLSWPEASWAVHAWAILFWNHAHRIKPHAFLELTRSSSLTRYTPSVLFDVAIHARVPANTPAWAAVPIRLHRRGWYVVCDAQRPQDLE